MKKIITILSILSLVQGAAADTIVQPVLDNVDKIVTKSSSIIGGGVSGLLMGLAFVAFLLSIINFLWKRRSGEGDGVQDAKNMLGWSVIAMFVMVAVWGLVTFISQTFNIGLGGNVKKPEAIPVTSSNTSNNSGNPTPSYPGGPTIDCSQDPNRIECR